MLTTSITKSGFQVIKWIERLVFILLKENKLTGNSFYDSNRDIIQPKRINKEFWSQLDRVQKLRPDLIAGNFDIQEVYETNRHLRSGLVTREREWGDINDAIDTINHWRTAKIK